jgi:hypothetical protein
MKINKRKFFQNGNLILPLEMTTELSFAEIAERLNISCQEVCNQFNRMVKESNYSLFN